MNPLITIFALDPLFPVNISVIPCVNIDLVAVVTKLVVLERFRAPWAEPSVLFLTEFPPGPLLCVTTGLQSAKLVEANLDPFVSN